MTILVEDLEQRRCTSTTSATVWVRELKGGDIVHIGTGCGQRGKNELFLHRERAVRSLLTLRIRRSRNHVHLRRNSLCDLSIKVCRHGWKSSLLLVAAKYIIWLCIVCVTTHNRWDVCIVCVTHNRWDAQRTQTWRKQHSSPRVSILLLYSIYDKVINWWHF